MAVSSGGGGQKRGGVSRFYPHFLAQIIAFSSFLGVNEILDQVMATIVAAIDAARAALKMAVELIDEIFGGLVGDSAVTQSPVARSSPTPLRPTSPRPNDIDDDKTPDDDNDDDATDDASDDPALTDRRRLVRRLSRAIDVSARSIVAGVKQARSHLAKAVRESEPQLRRLAQRAAARRSHKTRG